MLLAIIATIIGLALLVYSADYFIDGASSIASKFGMSKFLIGMLIIGIGTSTPEIVVSVFSALENASGLALGNAYGSNIVNILLVLGATAIISPILIQKSLVKTDFLILIGVTALAIMQLMDGSISRLDSIILLLGLIVFIGFQIYVAKKQKRTDDGTDEIANFSMTKSLIYLIGGLIVLVASSRLVVWGAVEIAKAMGMSDLIIGLTVVAVGTSLPELVSSIIAAKKGEDDMAIGNVVGSNIFNTLAVVGVAGVIAPMRVPAEVISRDMWVMAGVTIGLFVLCLIALRGNHKTGGRISRGMGALLLGGFVAYTAWLAISVMG